MLQIYRTGIGLCLTTHETPSIISKLELSKIPMEKNSIQLLCDTITFRVFIILSEKQNIRLDDALLAFR